MKPRYLTPTCNRNLRKYSTIKQIFKTWKNSWRSSLPRQKLLLNRIKISKRRQGQSSGKRTTTSMNLVGSLMFTVRSLRCTCATYRSSKRLSARFAPGLQSSVSAMTGRRLETRPSSTSSVPTVTMKREEWQQEGRIWRQLN